jgi:hypothetical protein
VTLWAATQGVFADAKISHTVAWHVVRMVAAKTMDFIGGTSQQQRSKIFDPNPS